MKRSDIPDANITASSSQRNDNPYKTRLDSEGYWISSQVSTEKPYELPWIQVEFGKTYVVTKLRTSGGGQQYWVDTMKVKVGLNAENLIFLEDGDGNPKVCRHCKIIQSVKNVIALPIMFSEMIIF